MKSLLKEVVWEGTGQVNLEGDCVPWNEGSSGHSPGSLSSLCSDTLLSQGAAVVQHSPHSPGVTSLGTCLGVIPCQNHWLNLPT